LHEGCRGALWEVGTAQFFLLLCHLMAGDVATLSRLSHTFHDEATARGDLLTSTNLRVRVLPGVALLNGQPERAREWAEPRVAQSDEVRLSIQAYWREISLIEHALYTGKAHDALARVRGLWPIVKRENLLVIRGLYLDAHWLRARATLAALAAGDRSASARDVRRIETASDMGGSAGLALALRAALSELQGQRADAIAAFRGAEAQLRADGRALLSQLARLRRGLAGDDAEAERARRDAEVWLHGAGVPDTRRVLAVHLPGLPPA
jgi:hypothetical protein